MLTSTLQASAANAALCYHCCCAAIFAPNSDKKISFSLHQYFSKFTNLCYRSRQYNSTEHVL